MIDEKNEVYMMNKQRTIRKYKQIEQEFFEIDEENMVARISLRFDSPDDIFDTNCCSRIPIFNDDFDEWIQIMTNTPRPR